MKKRILLVDDKPTIAKIISFYLASECEIIYKMNPLEAIKWFHEVDQLPDLIITDIRMPEMRGDEFVTYLKSTVRLKNIPVVVLSSEDRTDERIRLLQEGAEDYIVKPFNPLEIKARILRILSRV